MRGPVCTPSHRGRGRRPGPCPVGMGQEALDSRARPFERRGCNCEFALRSGGSAQGPLLSLGSTASPAKIRGVCVAVRTGERGSESPKPPQRGAARRMYLVSDASFGAPTSHSSGPLYGKVGAAEGFGVGFFSPSLVKGKERGSSCGGRLSPTGKGSGMTVREDRSMEMRNEGSG